MLNKIVDYLQKYLGVCVIVYFTFILPLIFSGVSYQSPGFDSDDFKTHLSNEINFILEPFLSGMALILLILSLYRFSTDRKKYKRQLIISIIISTLIIWGMYLP